MSKIGNSYREIAENAARNLGERAALDGNLLDLNFAIIYCEVEDKIGFSPENAMLLNAYEQGFREGWKTRYFDWDWLEIN